MRRVWILDPGRLTLDPGPVRPCDGGGVWERGWLVCTVAGGRRLSDRDDGAKARRRRIGSPERTDSVSV